MPYAVNGLPFAPDWDVESLLGRTRRLRRQIQRIRGRRLHTGASPVLGLEVSGAIAPVGENIGDLRGAGAARPRSVEAAGCRIDKLGLVGNLLQRELDDYPADRDRWRIKTEAMQRLLADPGAKRP
jgi:hypothetical protein